jgi:hypothetical protein
LPKMIAIYGFFASLTLLCCHQNLQFTLKELQQRAKNGYEHTKFTQFALPSGYAATGNS